MKLIVLSNDDITAIDRATLRILAETGIILNHEGAREKLCEAGAHTKGDHLYLPSNLVEWALSQCPSKVSIKGRGGKNVVLGDGKLHWHNVGGARDVYDPPTRQVHPATIKDVIDSARILDALDNVTAVVPFFTPQDVPGEIMSLAMYRHTLPYTTKPVQGPGIQTRREVQIAVQMTEVIGPPSEFLTLGISPVSPLVFPNDVVDAMMEAAKTDIALSPLPCPTAGTTAPMSIVGAIAQQNAEILASLVLAELVRPGLPIVYTGRLAMMEPRTGLSVWGGVELALASAATVQLGHYYGLPVNVYGLSTNSQELDIQNGYERALNAAIPALAGADELSGVGEMQAGIAGSFAQMVCDNEIAGSVGRLRRGISVDDDALGVEVIASVMEGTHNFLGQRHTRRYLRAGEVFLTKLAVRDPWAEWERKNRDGMAEHAQAEAERILDEHQVPPLNEEQDKELNNILQAALKELVNNGND